MRRVWRITQLDLAQAQHLLDRCRSKIITPKPSAPILSTRQYSTQTPDTGARDNSKLTDVVSLLTEKWRYNSAETKLERDLKEQVSKLEDEILSQDGDVEKIGKVLEEKGVPIFRRYSDGSALVELLTKLKSSPSLAMEVFNWRRKQLDYSAPMTVEEYGKGIMIAGKLKKVDRAIELFEEACSKELKATNLYNALMSAYAYNGLTMKCRSLFRDLKMETTCTPSIITYNILISAFGRLMLVDHMEATLREIKNLNLSPTVYTYRVLIAGYITAWMWEEMEKTYLLMKAGPVKPNLDIHLLMLRGYAHSGKLEKMEEMYKMIKDKVDNKEFPLIRAMICAYCSSSDAAKVEKVEELLKLIPENEYRPWLNVLLICLYAREDLLEQMENSINEAFERKAYITTVGVMRCIISSYFRHNAVDKLADFAHRAEQAGWRICQSVYHCKMVLYASQMRLSEMERVLDEMDKVNVKFTKKTFWILFKAYEKWGQKSKLEQVIGMMCKHGYHQPLDTFIS